MVDEIQRALDIGEVAFALRLAKAGLAPARAAGPRQHLDALRRHAVLLFDHADDEDTGDLARSLAAWTQVVRHELATDDDRDMLAWAQLLAGKRAKASLVKHEATQRAIAWSLRRTDAKRLAALEDAADDDTLERVVRLLVQAHVPSAPRLSARLLATREEHVDTWDPAVARAVRLHVAASRIAGDHARADADLARWTEACEAALHDPTDPRRHVLDGAADDLTRAQRRVERVTRHLGGEALEPALAQLAFIARQGAAHAVAVAALERLEKLHAKARTQVALRELSLVQADLYKSQIALGRYDEAFATIARYEKTEARIPLHLVPAHHARAAVYEAMGDHERLIAEHLAAVAQYEAAPPPAYGPDAPNTALARGWARQALERIGRHAEADARFPKT